MILDQPFQITVSFTLHGTTFEAGWYQNIELDGGTFLRRIDGASTCGEWELSPWVVGNAREGYEDGLIRGLYGNPPACPIIVEDLPPPTPTQCQAILIYPSGPTRCKLNAAHSPLGGAPVSGGGHDWFGQ